MGATAGQALRVACESTIAVLLQGSSRTAIIRAEAGVRSACSRAKSVSGVRVIVRPYSSRELMLGLEIRPNLRDARMNLSRNSVRMQCRPSPPPHV